MAHTPDPMDQTGTLDTSGYGEPLRKKLTGPSGSQVEVDEENTVAEEVKALDHTESQDETDEAAVRTEGHQPPNRT